MKERNRIGVEKGSKGREEEKLSWRKDEGLSKGEGGLSGGGKGSLVEETKSIGGREWLFG